MFISLTPAQSVARALKIAALKTKYILGAGGRNPLADTPFTIKDGELGSDCIGFVLWCLGLDRFQPVDGKDIEFPFYGGWINTDSLLMDVKGQKLYFEEVEYPRPGDMVVYPSLWKDGKMIRMGHIGLVVEVPNDWPISSVEAITDKKVFLKQVKIIDCAAAKWRKLIGKAVNFRDATLWNKPDAKFVRFKWQSRAIQTLSDPTNRATPEMASPKLGDRVLRLNQPLMRGADVQELQRRLKITVDGIFGYNTSQAVKKFQRSKGLFEDGIVGPHTAAKL